MTTINSYGLGTTAGQYTLVMSGITLPRSITMAWVEDFTSVPVLETPVTRRHNFWASNVVLDGRNPALSYNHEVKLYVECGSIGAFSDAFFSLNDHFSTNCTTVTINDGDRTTVRYSFGSCYLEDVILEEPDALLKFRAGMVRMVFVGNTQPERVS